MSDQQFEVEKKYPLKGKEGKTKVECRLKKLGFVFCGETNQYDYMLPGSTEGERIRIREEGTSFFQTYKSSIMVDGEKVRREEEPEIHPVTAHLAIIGAKKALRESLPTMFKHRRMFKRNWGRFVVNVLIDKTPVLSSLYSGYFMEVEIMVEDPEQVVKARRLVTVIAASILGETREPAKLSYRKMLFNVLKKKGKFPKRWKALTGSKGRTIQSKLA